MQRTCPISIIIPMVVGITAVSFSSIFVKWSNAPVSVQGMYRLLFTVLLLLPFSGRYAKKAISITKRTVFLLFLSGACLATHFLFWMGSVNYPPLKT